MIDVGIPASFLPPHPDTDHAVQALG